VDARTRTMLKANGLGVHTLAGRLASHLGDSHQVVVAAHHAAAVAIQVAEEPAAAGALPAVLDDVRETIAEHTERGRPLTPPARRLAAELDALIEQVHRRVVPAAA